MYAGTELIRFCEKPRPKDLGIPDAQPGLKIIARQICTEYPQVKSVQLFGSIARNQVGTSDVDVLIVLYGHEPVELIEQIRLFYPYFNLPSLRRPMRPVEAIATVSRTNG